jgi:hypothetical protein
MSNDLSEGQGRQDRLAAPGPHLARRATAGRARDRARASTRPPAVPGRWRWENIRARPGRLPDGQWHRAAPLRNLLEPQYPLRAGGQLLRRLSGHKPGRGLARHRRRNGERPPGWRGGIPVRRMNPRTVIAGCPVSSSMWWSPAPQRP